MNADQLTNTTMQLFGVTRADLFSDNRTIRIAEARQALAWALRQNDWSLEAIGAYLHRDHTTIMFSLKQVEKRARRNRRFADRLECLSMGEDFPQRIARLESELRETRLALAAAQEELCEYRNALLEQGG